MLDLLWKWWNREIFKPRTLYICEDEFFVVPEGVIMYVKDEATVDGEILIEGELRIE